MEYLPWLILIIYFVYRDFFRPYLGEKGKNYATREDIQEITRKIESVRTAVNMRFQISRFRYEKEYSILEALSAKAVDLRDATKLLRPVVDQYSDDQTPEQRKQFRIERYREAMRAMYELTEKSRPFYPEEIYNLIGELDKLGWREAVAYKTDSPDNYSGRNRLAYWDEGEANCKRIGELADDLIDMIRRRIRSWEDLDLLDDK